MHSYIFMKMMRKIYRTILPALLLLCACNHVFATETRITQLFITNDGNEYRHTFLYNSFGDIQLETKYLQSGNTWLRQSQTEWFYNSSNLLIAQQQRVFENGAWQNTDLIEIDYNFFDQKQEVRTFQYISGMRTPIKRVVYENPGNTQSPVREYRYQNGVPQLSIAHSFSIYSRIIYDVGVFIVVQQDIEVYDAGILDFTLVSFINYETTGIRRSHTLKRRIGDVYQNMDSTTWFYNEAGKLISQRSKTWNERGAYWINTQRIDFEYDANGNLIAENYLQWSGMHWQNAYRYEFQYENGVKIRKTLQANLHRDWRDLISIHYADFHNNKAQYIRAEYNFWGGNVGELAISHIPFMFNDEMTIRRAERIRISYDELPTNGGIGTGTANPDFLIRVFPNPSDGIFYLSTDRHEIISWKVFSPNGQMLKSHVQRFHTGVIDLTDLPSGIYILQVETTIGTQQQRLIKR